jgi:hypothetical protein
MDDMDLRTQLCDKVWSENWQKKHTRIWFFPSLKRSMSSNIPCSKICVMITVTKNISNKTKKRKFFVVKMVSSVYNYFVSWDNYGQPVTLNYNGSDVFQTFPGAVLSIFSRMFMSVYIYYKILALVQNTNWTLVS